MIDIGKGVVALGKSVLDALIGAEVVSIPAVHLVSVLLAPCLVKDRKSAVVPLPYGIYQGDSVREGVVVNMAFWKAWCLALILQDYNIPVTTSNLSQTVRGVMLKLYSSWGHTPHVDIVPRSTPQLSHHIAQTTCITVTKEQNILVSPTLPLLAGVREPNTLVRTASFFWVCVCGTVSIAVSIGIRTKYYVSISIQACWTPRLVIEG